jgi:hypothetical protein
MAVVATSDPSPSKGCLSILEHDVRKLPHDPFPSAQSLRPASLAASTRFSIRSWPTPTPFTGSHSQAQSNTRGGGMRVWRRRNFKVAASLRSNPPNHTSTREASWSRAEKIGLVREDKNATSPVGFCGDWDPTIWHIKMNFLLLQGSASAAFLMSTCSQLDNGGRCNQLQHILKSNTNIRL